MASVFNVFVPVPTNMAALFHSRSLVSFLPKCSQGTAATACAAPPTSYAVEFLVNSCGLPLESALSTSKKLRLDEKGPRKHEAVLELLKSCGFDSIQIGLLVRKRPNILHCKVENNLKPKIEYLMENGFVGQLLTEVIVRNPTILMRSLDSHIKPSIEFIQTIVADKEKVVATVKRYPALLTNDLGGTMQSNIDLLRRKGVPSSAISKLFVLQPRAILQKADRMVNAIETAEKWGTDPSAPMFIHFVRVLVSMSDSTWNRKLDLFKSFGWSDEDLMSTFKRHPLCFSCSEKKLMSVVNFYVNTMKLKPETLRTHPILLMYAIDKRIRPRYHVYKILVSNKLINGERGILSMLMQDEKRFVKNYIEKYSVQVPGLEEIYQSQQRGEKLKEDEAS